MNGLATDKAPDVWLPLRHLLIGAVSLLLAVTLLGLAGPAVAFEPTGNPHALAVTHLVTLGWVTLTIIGASYQMVPVVLQARLWSEKLGYAVFWLFLPGVAAMALGFWFWQLPLLIGGGSLVVLALLLYTYNIARTLATVRDWGLHGPFFAFALAFLLAVAGYGLTLAINFVHPFLAQGVANHLVFHLLLGIVGWITILAIGVAYKLGPMFALSHGRGNGFGRTVLLLIGGGDALLIALLAVDPARPAILAAAFIPLAGVLLFLYDQWLFYRTRHRARLDLGLRFMAFAYGYLGLAAILTFVAAGGWLSVPPAALIVLALLGWAGCLIFGQLYKIVPFLVWYNRYGNRAGRERVPLLREMYSAPLGEYTLRTFVPVAAVLALGIVVKLGAIVDLAVLAAFAATVMLLLNLRHVLRT